ncbi:MAG TPA: nucleotide exchange factor GrpE [Acidimicrobiia bacterium]|jgi:molecular chaperone GrpE
MADQHTVPKDQGRENESGSDRDARIAELEAEVADLEDRWKRALADIDNLWKRFAREVDRVQADERARVVADWLPVVDNLELALDHAGADPDAIVEGVRAVHEQAMAALARLGFVRRGEVGERFDPARHEAVSTVTDAAAPPGTVVHVVRPGYGEGDRQLRPAAVVVSKRPE